MFNLDVLIAVLGTTSEPDKRPVGINHSLWSLWAGAGCPFNSSPPSLPYKSSSEADTLGGRGVAWTGKGAFSLVSISGKTFERGRKGGMDMLRALHLYSIGRWGGQRTLVEFDLKEEVDSTSSSSSPVLDLQHSALATTCWSGEGWMEEQEQRPATLA